MLSRKLFENVNSLFANESEFVKADIRFSFSTFFPGVLLLSLSTITRSKGNGAEHLNTKYQPTRIVGCRP